MSGVLYLGCSRELLAKMDPCSVDAIVTDPPYEIGFMGRSWDSTGIAYDPDFWRLCLNVLKPGGHLVSFGACRTYHRIACAIEDAGFEIRDSLHWLFGSGFPKSLDISKAIDKAAGAEREVVGKNPTYRADQIGAPGLTLQRNPDITAPATPEAQQWEGWGTSAKPSYEPCVLARKPIKTTVADNVLAYRTGGLNIDACRVGEKSRANGAASQSGSDIRTASAHENAEGSRGVGDTTTRSDIETRPDTSGSNSGATSAAGTSTNSSTGESGARQTGRSRRGSSFTTSTGRKTTTGSKISNANPAKSTAGSITETETNTRTEATSDSIRSDGGSAGRWPPNVMISPLMAKRLGGKSKTFPVFDYGDEDRFFYAPKASREEREAGCEHLPGKTADETVGRDPNSDGAKNPRAGAGRGASADRFSCRRCGISLAGGRAATACADSGDGKHDPIKTGTGPTVRNFHPTVKPVSLMRWLCRLITPPGGLVLDPFAGSGTTGIAAVSEGFDFVGIELDPDHHAIAMARIEHAAAVAPETNRADYEPPKKKQLGLF